MALDLGCGAGDNARILTDRGWQVHGITFNLVESKSASRHCDEMFLADLDGGLPESVKRAGRKYTVVILSHVLEHLINPVRLLLEIREVLVSGGFLLIALPNVVAYPNRLRIMGGGFDYEPTGIMDETHVHFYTFKSGAKLLRQSNYEIVSSKAEGAFPLWKLRRLLPAGWVKMLNRGSCRLLPGVFGFQLCPASAGNGKGAQPLR